MCRTAADAKYNMHNRLESAVRLLIRIALALFTGVVLLLIQSVFWNNAISFLIVLALFAVALLALFRPQNALLVLAGLAPLAQIWAPLLGSRMRGGEAMVLAFLAGALLRGWTLGRFRNFPSDRLQTAAAVLGAVVATSCLEQLWFSQIQLDYPGPFLRETMAHLGRTYFTSFRGYGGIFHGMLLLEGLALLLCVVHYSRVAPAFGPKVVRVVALSAVGAAAFNLAFFAQELMETGEPLAQLPFALTVVRWSAHVGDINAAGSFFVMAAFIALGLALTNRGTRVSWIAGGLLIAIALWLTGSRTAFLAALLVGFVSIGTTSLRRVFSLRATVLIMSATLVVGVAAIWQLVQLDSLERSGSRAVMIRWLFLGTTWRMLVSEPVFGFGIGQYALWSKYFSAPQLLAIYERENAHNNFAQVAGELGLVGLAAFVMVLASAFWYGRRLKSSPHPAFAPVTFGLAAFILTWLGGHPLLVPEVSYPFWIALGVVAGLAPPSPAGWRSAAVVAVIGTVLLVSLPARVENKTGHLDLSRVRLGFSEQQVASTRGRIFIEAGQSHVALPLRAWGVSHDNPLEVDVFVDGRFARTIRLADGEWRSERVDIEQPAARRFHQIDLQVRQPVFLEDAGARSRRGVQVGHREIMPKPNG
jgi:O-antigen ligase